MEEKKEDTKTEDKKAQVKSLREENKTVKYVNDATIKCTHKCQLVPFSILLNLKSLLLRSFVSLK